METHGFTRTYTVGTIDTGRARRAVVEVKVEYTAPGELRHGQERPNGTLGITASAQRPGARDWDAGGQMDDELRAEMARGGIEYREGWDAETLARLLDAWDAWHLNDMRAGCEHQRAAGWKVCHGYHSPGLTCKEEPKPGAASPEDVAAALDRLRTDGIALVGGGGRAQRCELDAIGRPCPECGYKYGTAWLSEPVPADVLAFLRDPHGTGEVD
jgi:hypothetical protein